MKLSDFSVRRPVTIIMVFAMVVILGIVSLSKIAIDLYPELEFPVAAVITNYDGASPVEIETLITRPMEEYLGTVSGVESITSITNPGSSLVLVWFEWGTDMNHATLKMREKVDILRAFLPEGISSPMVATMDPSNMPILQMAVSGDRNLADLKVFTEDVLKPRLERIQGVASVTMTGGLTREIQIEADETKLKGYGLSLSQLAQVLRSENVNLGAGQVEEAGKNLYVRTLGEFRSVDEISEIRFTTPSGVNLRIGDVAVVRDTYAEQTQYTRSNGVDSIGIHILKATGGNLVEISKRVKAEVEKLQPELEARGVKLEIQVDQSLFIERSINNVKSNAYAGGILAVIVLMFFLRNWRSTLIIGLAIPISIISTFILIHFAGLTLNVMSLGGLALGVGMMVDSSIVILENIFRYRQKGYSIIEAAKEGSAEVGTAVAASTLTTLAVFLPIVFVEGLAANLFKQLALTVSFSLAASFLVAVTLVPMLSSKFLDNVKESDQYRWSISRKVFSLSGRFLDSLNGVYEKALAWSLGHRKTVVAVVIAALVASVGGVGLVGAEFLPEEDTGEISISMELDKGTVITETTKVADQVEAILKEIPEVKTVFTSIGATGGGMGLDNVASELAAIRVKVGSKDERERHTKDIADEVRTKISEIPGVKARVSMADNQGGGGAGGGSPIDVKIKGQDLETLQLVANRVKEVVEKIPGTREVRSSLEDTRPEIQIVLDRQRAGALGLSAGSVANSLQASMIGQVATKYKVDGTEYDVRVKLNDGGEKTLEELEAMTITTPAGQNVPLREVANLVMERGPNAINREDQSRVINVTGQLLDRDLGSVSKDITEALKGVEVPPGYTVEMGGQNEEMVESFTSLGLALILAIILVYMVMASQFESFVYPFIIMFTLPTTFIGVVLGMVLTGNSFSVPAFIGVIMLAGIVVNNGIVLVDYINTLRQRGISRDQAIKEAGSTRLRPILMTTLTTVLALLPLTLGLGEGGETQAPMAITVVGGLTVSTVFTLVLIPVVYTLMDDLEGWVGRKIFRRSAHVEESI